MTGHLLEVENLSVRFHSRGKIVDAVRSVSWHLDRGETLAILGESGSGKSVSASAVMGLIDTPPGEILSGSIRFDGRGILGLSAKDQRELNGRRIAMIFQDTLAALNPVHTLGHQISESMTAHGIPAERARTRAIELLARVGIPEPERRFNEYPHQFSGGQRQRVMIAAAIAMEPDVLIADEPTSALDVTVQAGILKLLKELQAENGMGILMITHDLGVVAEIADRVVVMSQGEVVEQGPLAEVLGAPRHAYTRRLLEAVPGRHGYPAARDLSSEALIEIRGLSKYYGVSAGVLKTPTGREIKALDDVSLTLNKGEVLGVVGESGSGKTTLVNTLLGLVDPTKGEVLYRGKSMLGPGNREIARNVQVVFQDPTASLNPRMKVGRIIAEPWAIHRGVLPRAEWPRRVAELLEQVGLRPEHADRYPHQFSGGQRQRIAIARALALKPEVIICDEAVSALDVSIQAQVIQLLKDLRRDHGLSYLFIAHDLPVVRDFADRTIVMQGGRIVESGITAEIFEHPRHPYTQKLLASRPVEERMRGHITEPAE
ncbi:ABC transporter ATP-binding protein [Paracoccus laeviglucosivorans]|uniref:Peptide/nickel transport system ATP-binding protein n=1 Tax=Paracoccus laeviglucosivorans TaxID=1197861 RepID=A0A521FS36_9RHOB|nr:ABC transporter ATP-binding protein [Paracoccus laeviglucosivorans]SMO98926.1 peptide/nickel transport system ATP-binding protein [Paracoccus laeviglucosivorans]